jgi:xylulokinase
LAKGKSTPLGGKEVIGERTKFLGLDLSTRSLTALVIDFSEPSVVFRASLAFDDAYPSYQTRGGVLASEDPRVVHANPRMWVEAVDDMLALLDRRRLTKQISAVSVSAQQHGSVYLNADAAKRLMTLNPDLPLVSQIGDIFSRSTAPVWMDSSTSHECAEITKSLGGDSPTAVLTGSKATERFTGPQIRKFWKENPGGYEETTHIALVSSFVTSLLLGFPAPVDCGDGFGTNLANVRTGRWSRRALSATAPRLKKKLPDLVRGDVCLGKVSHCLVKRHGFDPETDVTIGTGDNPASLVGLGLIGDRSRHAVSLGTSDTYFGYTAGVEMSRGSEGHIFGAADGRYMFLLCFKNGSLAREAVKNQHGLSWKDVSRILLSTPPGNQGRVMLPYFLPEITPLVLSPEVRRFGGLREDDVQGNVRAVAEAQVMSMFLHSRRLGVKADTLLVTAGGSGNEGLLQVIADVFDAEVRAFEVEDSAALGAAVRAARGFLVDRGDRKTWSEPAERLIRTKEIKSVLPRKEAVRIYRGENGLLNVYQACETSTCPEGEINRFRSAFRAG